MEMTDYFYYAKKYEKEICSEIANCFCNDCINFAYMENNDNTLIVPIRTKNKIHFVEVNVKYNPTLSELSEGYTNKYETDE
jgi:hypothetical protein